MTGAVAETIRVRASVNEWVSQQFPAHRRYISHSILNPIRPEDSWCVALETKNVNGHSVRLAEVYVTALGQIVCDPSAPSAVMSKLDQLLAPDNAPVAPEGSLHGQDYDFILGDGIKAAETLEDASVDLLLTDPPYGISKPYTCEKQVPRRLRKDGRDFIMPKGNFGEWDRPVEPVEWLEAVLPKVRGWFVTFCAQAQIGTYVEFLRGNRFVAVGTLVWYKTNPVPFNHRFKPINAWEAVVVGKRSGTKFNGSVVHNVFRCKSPSPQQRIHPTQKPLDLVSKFVELFSEEGQMVFDPFAGAATTLIAASTTGRKSLSYENDPAIYHAACERVMEHVR